MKNIDQIIKEAGILRAYLKSGKIDINRLDSFLSRVEQLASPGTRKVKPNRVERQLASFKEKNIKRSKLK